MIRLCLFDLDNTLLRTEDLEQWRGPRNAGRGDEAYLQSLTNAFARRAETDRIVHTPQQLAALRRRFPAMKWGVFTRSPRAYARTLLRLAYPGLTWDVVIAYEDVRRTKPFPDGVVSAMQQLGIEDALEVALVGDEKADVMAAYHSGCRVIIDQSTWPVPWDPPNYFVMERVPDAVIKRPEELAQRFG